MTGQSITLSRWDILELTGALRARIDHDRAVLATEQPDDEARRELAGEATRCTDLLRRLELVEHATVTVTSGGQA